MSYINNHKRQTLDSIENQVLYADLCCVIIGPQHIGKSFFLAQLAQRTSAQVAIAQISCTSQLMPEGINTQISECVGFDLAANGVNIIEKAAAKLSQRILVMFDDAEQLNQQARDYLLDIVKQQFTQKNTQLFILLSGTSKLAEQLAQSEVLKENPDLCAVFELQPFEQNETQHLIADFQEIDVGTALALYDEQKIDYFWRLSQGLPGQLKLQIERWLNQQEVVKPEVVHASKAGGYVKALLYSVVCLGLVFILIFQDEINQSIDETETLENISPQSLELETPDLKRPTKAAPSSSTRLTKQQDLAKPGLQNQPKEPTTAGLKTSQKVKAESNAQQALSQDDIAENQESQPKANAEKAALSEQSPKTAQIEQTKSLDQAPVSKQNTSNKATDLTEDEVYLSTLSANLFTLQWVGLSSYESALSYRNKHPLKDQMSIFRRKTQQGYLYLVISNTYLSKVDAEHARVVYIRRDYPGKPWIKTLKSVQQDIANLN
ncbi:AAA family ATPase [Aliikangiella sp. IMCC44632]